MIAIFLFYNMSSGKQARLAFSKDFKHCNIITFDGEYWINYELDSYGIHTKVLETKDGVALLRGLKIIKPLLSTITVWINDPVKINWKPLWVKSCNEFDRYVSGVDIGFTWNPRHLYSKLIKYDKKRNFEILQLWRR